MSTRRHFLMATGAVAATQIKPKTASANDTVRIAVLGVNGRGKSHIAGLQPLPNVEIAVLCDPDLNVAGSRAKAFEEKYGQKVEVVQDLRKVFERKDIDAVTVATPNHWHSLATIWACQAGKDVYVEKPGSHNVYEGRKMVEAAHKYNRIVQHGVQLRSSPALREAVQMLNDGIIGKVYMSRGLVYRWRPSIGKSPTEPVPAGIDYDLWTGPAEKKPFSKRYVHYNWHWHWNYGNGDVGNQGIHETDMCMWGLGLEKLPSKVTAMGGKFLWDDDKECPEVLSSSYLYPDEKKMIQFEVRHWCTNTEDGVGVGNIFYGEKGVMLIKGYHTYEVYFGRNREPGPKRKEEGDHYANFIKAVRSRKTSDQHGPVETAHMSSSLAHLGNISYRLGRVLDFDPKTEKFTNDAEADKMLTRNYRPGYAVPEKV
jgi:predicted dehydrogenase